MIKIFIASSSDLAQERKNLKITIDNEGFESVLWEYIDQSFNGEKFQDYINDKHLIKSDIVIFMFKSRVGKFTLEEFNLAYKQVPKNIKKIYTYFFKPDYNSLDKKELFKILQLQDFLEKGGLYFEEVEDYNELENHLLKQLSLLKKEEQKSEKNIEDIVSTNKQSYKIYLKEHMKIPTREYNFVGREKNIKDILSDLKNRKKINLTTSLVAGGGVGKSTLATEIAHQIRDSWSGYSQYLDKPLFTDGILWIKLEQEHTIENILEKFIEPQIGIALNSSNYEDMLARILFKKDILIVIDSAEQNVKITNKLLALFRFFPILVTSRVPVSNIPNIIIGSFNKEKSIELFEKHLSRKLEGEERKEIGSFSIKTLGGLPLAISIIASYMKTNRRSLKDVVANNNILNMPYQDKITLDSVFDLSYNMLSSLAQKIFAIASVNKYPFQEEYLLEIVKKDDSSIDSIFNEMNELIRNSLLEVDRNNVYSFHPLVRDYAFKKFLVFPNSKDIIEAKKEYLLSLADNERKIDSIYNELIYIIEDDFKDKNYTRFIGGVKKVDWWLQRAGIYSKREELLKKAMDVVDKDEDKYIFLRSYADNLNRQGKNEESEEYLEKAFEYNFSKKDCFLYYSYYANEYELNNFSFSYKKNLEYARVCLLKDKTDYSSFYKTNSWITNDYLQLNKSLEYAKINALTQGIRNNKFKSLNDLIKIYFNKNLYKEVVKISDHLKEVYWSDREFDTGDKLELMLHKSWSQLYLENQSPINTIAYIEKNFNLLELNEYDEVQKIKILYYLNKEEYSIVDSLFRNILNEKTREYYEGIYKSYIDEEEAKKILEKVLKEEKEELYRADIKLYLAKVLVKIGKIEEAVKYLKEATDFLNEYMTPIQENIVLQLKQEIGEDNFKKIANEVIIERVDDSFLLDSASLPKEIVSRDGKKMLLVEQGFSIYGEDNFDIPTIEELLNNPEDVLSNNKKLQSIKYLSSFYIDETPVSVKEYRTYCNEANIDFNNKEVIDENQPVRNLTIEEMQGYASFYGKTLPIPEEWEKACRGKDNLNYPWGDEWDETVPIKINEDDFAQLKELFVSHENFEEYFEWFIKRKQNMESITDEYQLYNKKIQTLFIHDTFEEYYNWYSNYDEKNIPKQEVLDKLNLNFTENIVVDKFYFFKLALNSLSLDVNDTLKVFQAVPELSQEQVDALIDVFEKEIETFHDELNKKHHEDIEKLYNRIKENSNNIIFKLQNEDFMELELFNHNIDLNSENMGLLNHIEFAQGVVVDKYYFFKLLFYSLSLNTLEKFRVIDAIPTLSQFQVDSLIDVFEEEVNKFVELNEEHPEDIIKLFRKMQDEALDIIGEISLKTSQYIETKSPYGVKNMVGNGYEVTMKENAIVFKGNIVTHDYKEKFKGKTSWVQDISEDNMRIRQVKEQRYSRATFRCVKPIFSMEDLEDVQQCVVNQIEYQR